MSRNKFFITIYDAGSNGKEVRLILNKLNCWNQPQCSKYFDSPFEFEVDIDESDLNMVIFGLREYCHDAQYSIIDMETKRNEKLNQLGI